MALLGALVLVLAGYSIREAMRSNNAAPATSPAPAPATAPGAAAGTGPAGIGSEPVPPVVSEPFPPRPAQEQLPVEPNDPGEQFLGVLVVPTDYWGESASDAVITAKSQGLVPRVVDEDGQQVDRDRRSRCRVTRVRPMAGFIPRGSTLELTCRRVR